MFEERLIDLGQPFQDCSIRSERFTLFDERADDIHAHGNCAVASEDVCHLKRAKFSGTSQNLLFSPGWRREISSQDSDMHIHQSTD